MWSDFQFIGLFQVLFSYLGFCLWESNLDLIVSRIYINPQIYLSIHLDLHFSNPMSGVWHSIEIEVTSFVYLVDLAVLMLCFNSVYIHICKYFLFLKYMRMEDWIWWQISHILSKDSFIYPLVHKLDLYIELDTVTIMVLEWSINHHCSIFQFDKSYPSSSHNANALC